MKKINLFSKILIHIKSRLRIVIFVFLGLIICTALFITVKYIIPTHRATNSIPQSIRDQVVFPLYAPSVFPSGYKVDEKSFTTNSHAVLYVIKKGGNNKIFISIQPKPNAFNFDNFHYKQMTGSKDLQGKAGKIVIGVFGDKTIASLVTEKSWVIINGDSTVSAKDLETISTNLIQVSQ